MMLSVCAMAMLYILTFNCLIENPSCGPIGLEQVDRCENMDLSVPESNKYQLKFLSTKFSLWCIVT